VTGAWSRLRDVGLRLRGGGEPRLRRQRIGLRRFLAAGLAAGAAAVALQTLAPGPPALAPVVVAARDVGAGHRLTADDLRVAGWAAPTRPTAALAAVSGAVGRVTAGPLDHGSPVTESNLLGPGLLTGQPAGLLAVPVRLADPAATVLVRRGDRVDVIAAASGVPIVTEAVVLAQVSGAADAGDGWGGIGGSSAGLSGSSEPSSGGAVVVLGVPVEQVSELARAQAAGALAIAVHTV
jgi:Flp pilus assembly protein CpaB